jgi:thiamine biosynthesis lipoprotein
MKNLVFALLLFGCATSAQTLRQRTVKLMGSRFDLTIASRDEASAEAYIDTAIAEISRIENVISEWMPNTEVSQVNANAGVKPVKVSAELLDLTERAIYFSKISDGAFDISFASADKIWKFDGSMTELPSAEKVAASVRLIGYQNIVINKAKSTIYLKKKGMKIGFGSIGKGYAADKTKELLMKKGVPAGIINASGDMNTWGKQPDGEPWSVGITNPLNKNKVFAIVPLHQTAVVTSGSYEKFALIDGKRYTHIINPKTGYPVSGLSSVTVFGPSAEMCNGFSTAIMVLGKDLGLALIARFPHLQCIVVSDEGDIFTSQNIELAKYRP